MLDAHGLDAKAHDLGEHVFTVDVLLPQIVVVLDDDADVIVDVVLVRLDFVACVEPHGEAAPERRLAKLVDAVQILLCDRKERYLMIGK